MDNWIIGQDCVGEDDYDFNKQRRAISTTTKIIKLNLVDNVIKIHLWIPEPLLPELKGE